MLDWKISIGAIIGILASGILGNFLINRRERQKEIIKFKQSFVPYLKALENPDANPTIILLDNYSEQDELARKLILHLPKNKTKIFLNHWKVYSDLFAEKKETRNIATIATEVDDISKTNLLDPNSIQYIYEQTEKRRIKVITIVKNALDSL